jgi:prepilin-type N-terminal cleavage/methylation domain-containing protein
MRSRPTLTNRLRAQRGVTLIELMMALVILSVGLMAVAQLFPAGTRGQVRDRKFSTANYYAQERLEEVSGKNWSDPLLSIGRHPAAAFETLGTYRSWLRFYQVDVMAAPLDNLRKVTVTVNWNDQDVARTVSVVTYVRR